jgi:hypothetical protein
MVEYPELKSATPLDNHCLILVFGEDEKRLYDFKPNLHHKFYCQLAEIDLFKKVSVAEGEIEWITGQDFCPHTLYEGSKPMM